LVFLANGSDIRVQSAQFHRKVKQALESFAKQASIKLTDIRTCDHQHLTYDLFAKNKGIEGSQAHKFRPMADRYLADDLRLPADTDALTYAIADFPINRRVRALVPIDEDPQERYNPLYKLISDTFINAAKQCNLHNGAVIANGLVPIVRRGDDDNIVSNGELLMLGYNPKHTGCGYICQGDSAKLVDSVQLVFVASEQDKTSHGYGKFVNQIEQALRTFTENLGFINEQEEMTVRLHQHVGFYTN
jgi:hypothetical protein